jgi:hypothetical protein
MNIFKTSFFPASALLSGMFFFITGCLVPGHGQKAGPDTAFHLYLLVGQSNMAGRGALDADSKLIDSRVMVLDKSNQWVSATDPLHFDKPQAAGVGPGFAFGKAMAAGSKAKIRIGLIPCAVGGSAIDSWQPGGYDKPTNTHPYDEALARARAAGQQGVFKGIIWHQGESDSSPGKAAVYLPKLITLVASLRRDLGNERLPFVAGELGYYREAYQNINTLLPLLPRQVPHTAVVSAEGLVHNGDGTHFDAASARQLGTRYAAAMGQLLFPR